MKKMYLLIIALLSIGSHLQAQQFEWTMKIPSSDQITSSKIAADTKGNVFVAANFKGTVTLGNTVFKETAYNGIDFFVAKFDAKGNTMWAIQAFSEESYVWNTTVDNQSNIYVTGSFSGPLTIGDVTLNGDRSTFIIKFDGSGKLLWAKDFSNKSYSEPGDVRTDNLGNAYFSIVQGGQSAIYKFDSHGNQSYFAKVGGEYPEGIATDAYGNVYMTGFFTFINADFGNNIILKLSKGTYISDSYVCKFDNKGKLLWVSQIIGSSSVESWNISVDRTGNSYISGKFIGQLVINKDTLRGYQESNLTAFIAKYDALGNPIWGRRIGSKGYGMSWEVIADASDEIYITASAMGKVGDFELPDDGGIIFSKVNKLGDFLWVAQPKGSLNVASGALATDKKGNFYLSGTFYGPAIFGKDTLDSSLTQSLFISKIKDSTFSIPGELNTISGHVFRDSNANCKQDAGEESLPNQLLRAEPGPYYGQTDSSGNYSLQVEKGSYTISQVLPVSQSGLSIQQICPAPPNSYQVAFSSYGQDTTGFDFGNQITKIPFLQVEVAADRRRRCFSSTTTVHYRNDGYAAATNVQVQLTYPKYVIPISSTTAWSNRKDSLLTFNIGTLGPGGQGTITIVDSVICGNESIRGLTQCVKAVITPKNGSPAPDPRWDKSDLELKALCKDNGFVRLTLLNSGTGAMADSASYRIYLDAVKIFESRYKLSSKDSLTLEVSVNGKTIRLEADLRPYHPDGNRRPSLTLEGCGGTSTVSISKGFVNQLPPDDSPEEIAFSCLEILDSFDPNDKQVTPEGVGENHTIVKGETLEYLIRFQNTGTDVAYNVTIQDTLDANLDIATLQIGAASHPFTWKVSGKGKPVITWTFKDINLPDSTSNEPQSHGYVRFRISQKPENDLGTTIINQAAITFDFNSPVLTNLTVNTVGEIPKAISSVIVDVCKGNYPTKSKAGEDVVLQTVESTTLQANSPQKGRGQWKLISGKATIAEPTNPKSMVTHLGAGKNILVWTITLCDSISTSQVTVERVIPMPAVTHPTVVVCAGEIISLTASGTNLIWYADEQLTRKVGQGNTLQATMGGEFFVTQTIDGYESKPAKVTAIVQSRPTPPVVTGPTRLYCQGETIESLQATGESIRWYADSELIQLLSTGTSFQPAISASATFYATQTVDGCEGTAISVSVIIQPARVLLEAKEDTLIAPLADAYQWYFEGELLANATAQWHLAQNTGNYHVELKKESCRVLSDPVYLSIHVPVSTLKVTPNPSPDRVQAELVANAIGRIEVRLLTTLGKVMGQFIWHKPTTILHQELDISHLPKGVYLLEVSTSGGILMKKIIKN